ncbi:MAG: host-nuclease inhibitor Gam family protein, partial [Gallionella sp.]|nr:host-nuclease inhibitor Gam family protein [Gallionella sp.]
MAKPARLKTPAQIYTSQSRDDAAADIRKIGDLQRDLQRVAAEMNDAIAHITSTYQPRLEAVNEQITTLQQGVQSWCEANRDDLTNGGKVKTANLIT